MVRILYDGACPFCVNYVRYARLRRRVGEVELVDAREAPGLVEAYAARGHEIDESFIVDPGEAVLSHGRAMAYIHANLAPSWTGLPMLANPKLLEAVYPFLRAGRNGALKVLGVSKIRPAAGHGLQRGTDAQEARISEVEKLPARPETPEMAQDT